MLRIVTIFQFRYYFKSRTLLKYSCRFFMMGEPQFFAEYAKQGRAKCKNCKEKIEKSCLRIGKLVPNHFSDDGGMMKEWYHMKCIFDKLSRARSTTKRIESTDEVDGFTSLEEDDKKSIEKFIAGMARLLLYFAIIYAVFFPLLCYKNSTIKPSKTHYNLKQNTRTMFT